VSLPIQKVRKHNGRWQPGVQGLDLAIGSWKREATYVEPAISIAFDL
jgi:hypothetical protein